ncbi:MAG: ATP-grasp domain-containing protein [Tindallia sp. MSAO_Bac2]|nr:MAG: ATP-grasp domain-containing protein [Tindallia sp. MSAO_Bac2]
MNFVILSPHFPPHYHRFWSAIKDLGVNTLGIGEDAYDSLAADVKASLTEYYQVGDMTDYQQLLRACGYFTHRYGKIHGIESNNEFWLETDAKLRTDFNVPGLKTEEMYPLKYKSGMKPVFQQAGIETVPGTVLKDGDQAKAYEFIKKHDYPVIAKPDNGVGAYATYKLNNQQDLENFLSHKLPVDYFLEKYVTGTIHSYDGMVDQQGNILLESGLVYGTDVMESVNENLDMFIYIPKELSPGIVEAGRKAVEAFRLNQRFFHIEFFVTSDNRIIALEVNARPPGGMIVDMINYANDINVYDLYAQLMVRGTFSPEADRKYNCFYIGRKNHYHYALSAEEIAALYPEAVVFSGLIPQAFAAAMGDHAIIVRTTSLDEGHEIRKAVLEK